MSQDSPPLRAPASRTAPKDGCGRSAGVGAENPTRPRGHVQLSIRDCVGTSVHEDPRMPLWIRCDRSLDRAKKCQPPPHPPSA